jgi:hypothetical protein
MIALVFHWGEIPKGYFTGVNPARPVKSRRAISLGSILSDFGLMQPFLHPLKQPKLAIQLGLIAVCLAILYLPASTNLVLEWWGKSTLDCNGIYGQEIIRRGD